jgi:DNA-binding FrmR family transcriptional regulator
MAVGVNINIILDKKLSDKECIDIHQQISAMKGTMSAHFNEKAKVIHVAHTGSEADFEQRVEKIKGVKEIIPLWVA